MELRNRRLRVVVAVLRGGLGNQMFQYALAKRIAQFQQRELVLDDLALDENALEGVRRYYELGIFPIHAHLTSRMSKGNERPPVEGHVVETKPSFCSEVTAPTPFACLYLNGYWQSEKYFKPIARTIRKEFQFAPALRSVDGWEVAIRAERMPVCVHVRRQDYLGPRGKYIGFVGREYYRRSVNAIAKRVPMPHFFVFSDDLNWCQATLGIQHPHTFVSHRTNGDVMSGRDLMLMTMCKHFIIANSSFSWWAAWLCKNRRKIVIAPERWFADSHLASSDVVPASWIRL